MGDHPCSGDYTLIHHCNLNNDFIRKKAASVVALIHFEEWVAESGHKVAFAVMVRVQELAVVRVHKAASVVALIHLQEWVAESGHKVAFAVMVRVQKLAVVRVHKVASVVALIHLQE